VIGSADRHCLGRVLVGLTRNGAQLGYQQLLWTDMTSRLNTAAGAGNIVTTSADLSNLNQLLTFDGVWIDTRQVDSTGTFSATEAANLAAFIASGRRVVMIGENNVFNTWDGSLLSAVGGTYAGGTFDGTTSTVSFVPLTTGVSGILVRSGGVAPSGGGGSSLFQDRVATVWGPAQNALVLLDSETFSDDSLAITGNSNFANNVASWITGGASNGAVRWNASASGGWNDPSSWHDGFMPSVADDATFNLAPDGRSAAGYTAFVNSSVAARNLLVPSDRVEAHLAGGTTLTLGQTIGVGLVSGSFGFLTLGTDSAANVTATTLSLGAGGSLGIGQGVTLSVAQATAVAGSSLSIAGLLRIQPPGGSPSAPITVANLSFSAGGQLDITKNQLLLSGTPAAVESMLSTRSIYTSSPGAMLGYTDAGGGVTQVSPALLGDTNLDGHVNVSDLANLAGNFGKTSNQLWINGDFDYNADVNVADLADLAANFGSSMPSGNGTATVATVGVVPEPATGEMIIAAGIVLRGARRSTRGRWSYSGTNNKPANQVQDDQQV
jgi:hypothetical protein